MAWAPPAGDTQWTPPAGDKRADAEAPTNDPQGRPTPSLSPGEAWQLVKGLGQGVIGIPEAIYQYAGGTIPEPLQKYQSDVESGWPGEAGELIGNIAGFVGGGALGDMLGLGARLPAVLQPARTFLRRPIPSSIVQSQIAQPVQGDDFWTQKGESALISAGLTKALGIPRALRQAAHNIAQRTNTGITQANEAARAAHAAQAGDIAAQNRAQAEAHAQTVATEREQHQALSEANQAIHDQERAANQRVIDALGERRERALAGREAQATAKGQVPAQTTAQWWRRASEAIGEQVPQGATSTGAAVQAQIGGRMNELTRRMRLDPHDPSLTDQLEEIRGQTQRSLQAHNQDRFFKEPPEELPEPPVVSAILKATGETQPRAGRPVKQKEPAKPSGLWQDHVLDPLRKGELTGQRLTEYISRLGDRANELATSARAVAPGNPERADLLAQADALRQVQDAVIGHAAGDEADKTALEEARHAYLLWGVGNDAAKASRGEVANPAQLIQMLTKRLGEARYKQALNNPASPYHGAVNWLQQQLAAHSVRIPTQAQATAGIPKPPRPLGQRATPIPRPRERVPPRAQEVPPAPQDRPLVEVPPAPHRPRRNIPEALLHGTSAAMLLGAHPAWAGVQAGWALRNLLGRAGGAGQEGSLEGVVRRALEHTPRILGRAARSLPAAVAGMPPVTSAKTRRQAEKIATDTARSLGSTARNLYYQWRDSQ